MHFDLQWENRFLSLVQNVILTLILSLSEIVRVTVKSHIPPNEENFDSIVNDITLELNDIALELSDGDITNIYEAGGDD